MQTARELLLTTCLPVNDIVASVGYRKAGSFLLNPQVVRQSTAPYRSISILPLCILL